MRAHKIIVRPENHWKSVTYLTFIRSKSIVLSWTSTNWKDASQRAGHSESHRYWTSWRRLASASTRLRLCRRRTFWAHTVIKMMWCDTCDFFSKDNNCQCVIICCYSVNHSNVHFIIVLTAQSDTSNLWGFLPNSLVGCRASSNQLEAADLPTSPLS